MAVRTSGQLRVFLFSATPRSKDLIVAGLPSEARLRRMGDAGGFTAGETINATGDGHALRLDGHEIAALDAEVDAP